MAIENACLGQEGDSVIFEPETFGHIAYNVVFDRQALEHLLDTPKRTRRRGDHVNSSTAGVKFLDFHGDRISPVRRKILRFAIQLMTIAIIELHAGNIHRGTAHKLARKLAHLEPGMGRVHRFGIDLADIPEGVLAVHIILCRIFRKERQFLENQRSIRQIVEQTGIERLVTPAVPPEPRKVAIVARRLVFLDRKFAHREKFHRLHGLYGTLRENVEATD